jgi:von Willebrand factor type A domain/Aerotolerance regulator N-terminal
MSLANPTALLWLLLAIPVVIFYILKIRLRRVPVSTVLFWRQIFDEKRPRSLWERLRHLLSLLVQLALLALLVAALAEPFFSWEALHSHRVILVVDNSASMSATDVAPSRLAKAKEEASRVVDGLRFRDEMAIVAAGTQPRVVCGLTGHRKTLRGALDGVGPTDGPTRLADAVAVARRLATEKDGGGKETLIVVVSDGCAEGAAVLSAGENVRFIAVGRRTANLGITRFQVRRSTIDPIGYEILAEVTNQSDEPTGDFRLSVALNGNPVDVKPLKLEANGKWSEVIESTTADGGLLTAELMVKGDKGDQPYPDALAADNRAAAVLPKREPIPVHLHSPSGNLFLQKVLEANPLVQLTTSKALPGEFPAGAIKVFHREVPATLPPGNVFVVDPTNDCDLWTVGDKLQNPIVTRQDKDSPLMAHVRLDNVLMPEARALAFTPAAGKPEVLAGAVTGEPLLALIDRPAGKVLVLTVNLDLGDLPFRTAFPILAMNALGSFTGGQGELRESLSTGAVADVALPSSAGGVSAFVLRSPDGTARQLPAGGSKVTVGPFDRCGVWSVVPNAPDAAPVETFAVNLMNGAESDLRPPDGLASSASAADAGLVSGFFGRPVWWYLIGLAWLLAAGEWYLYQRRWIN